MRSLQPTPGKHHPVSSPGDTQHQGYPMLMLLPLTSSLLCSTSGMGSCGASRAPSFRRVSLGSSPQAW